MNDLQIINLENTDISGWDFVRLRAELQRGLNAYSGLVYTDDSIKAAKNDRTTLNKVKKIIEDARKAYKAKCLAPYEAIEPQIKELVEMVERQRIIIDDTVKNYEISQKEVKEQEVRKYYDKKAVVLGELADVLYQKLFDKKWVNASTGKAKYEEGIQIAINGAYNDIKAIKMMNSPFVDTLLQVYVESLSMEDVKKKADELVKATSSAGLATVEVAAVVGEIKQTPTAKETVPANAEVGVSMRIYASQNQMNQICDFMKAIGVYYELL